MLQWNKIAACAPSRSAGLALSVLLASAATTLSPSAVAQTHYMKAYLDGNQVVPPIFSNGNGHACFVLDMTANTLSYYITFFGIGTETASHIHGFAPPGVEAGGLFHLPVGYPKIGTLNLTSDQAANILNGLAYVDIHTFQTGVEIRGQIVEVAPHTQFCFGDGSLTACPCGNDSAPGSGGCLNSIGSAGRLEASGFASTLCESLSLAASGMPDSTAVYFQGDATVDPVAFGDGLRCTGGNLTRLAVVTNVAGASQIPQPGGPPITVAGNITTLQTFVYQTYYRDPNPSHCPTGTFNVTSAVAVSWVP